MIPRGPCTFVLYSRWKKARLQNCIRRTFNLSEWYCHAREKVHNQTNSISFNQHISQIPKNPILTALAKSLIVDILMYMNIASVVSSCPRPQIILLLNDDFKIGEFISIRTPPHPVSVTRPNASQNKHKYKPGYAPVNQSNRVFFAPRCSLRLIRHRSFHANYYSGVLEDGLGVQWHQFLSW